MLSYCRVKKTKPKKTYLCIMRTTSYILIAVFLMLNACDREDPVQYSGTVTLTNEVSFGPTYYTYGLSITTGEMVSMVNDPLNVITIMGTEDDGNYICYFETGNYQNSFYLYDQYPDETTCKNAFNNLTSFTLPLQWEGLGYDVKENQIWLYRTSNEKYAKIRVISTSAEADDTRHYPYVTCTLEYVYQPDGTLTFPMK